MLGSLTLYRRLLNERVFNRQLAAREPLEGVMVDVPKLPAIGHALAGVMAGWTVSFIAAPVEHVKGE